MADERTKANANVRNLGKFMTATIPELVALGGGKSTDTGRVGHYKDFLDVFTPEKCAEVIDILKAKVGTVKMEKVQYEKDFNLEVRQLTALTIAVSKGGFSAASPNSIPKCLRALLYAKKNGHNMEAAVEQMQKEILQKKNAATANAMETDDHVVHEKADEAFSAKEKQKSQLFVVKEALEQKLRGMLESVQKTDNCNASGFHAMHEDYNHKLLQNQESTPAFNSQTPSGAFPFAQSGNVPEFEGDKPSRVFYFGEPGNVPAFAGEMDADTKGAAKAGGFMQSLVPFAPPSSPAEGASTPTKTLALTDGAEETATGKKRKQDDQASKKEAPAAADAAKASNKKSKTADAADKLQIAASGKTLAASATSSPDKKAAAKKDEEAAKEKEEKERLAKEKDKEEKERVKKERLAKEKDKEEKERLKKEKEAAKEKEEKERLAKEKDKEEKERLKKEKEAPAADAAKKDDDKRKSLQAEKEKLQAQLRNKKSPAATPASKGSHAGEPGKVPAFADDKWHADVKARLTLLEKKGKLKEAELDQRALKALKTLPYEVALVCLTKVMNEKNALRNINAFIVKNCTHLRNQWGIDDAASSSSEDDSSDDESEGEEEEEASKAKASTPAAAKAAPKVVDVKPVDDSDSEDDEDSSEDDEDSSEDDEDSSEDDDEEKTGALRARVASGI